MNILSTKTPLGVGRRRFTLLCFLFRSLSDIGKTDFTTRLQGAHDDFAEGRPTHCLLVPPPPGPATAQQADCLGDGAAGGGLPNRHRCGSSANPTNMPVRVDTDTSAAPGCDAQAGAFRTGKVRVPRNKYWTDGNVQETVNPCNPFSVIFLLCFSLPLNVSPPPPPQQIGR